MFPGWIRAKPVALRAAVLLIGRRGEWDGEYRGRSSTAWTAAKQVGASGVQVVYRGAVQIMGTYMGVVCTWASRYKIPRQASATCAEFSAGVKSTNWYFGHR